MSEAKPESSSRRILVVLDASPFGLEALEAAAGLAARLRAELQGLFVEDVDLLRLAGLPFARELAYSSSQRRLDVATMEHVLFGTAEAVASDGTVPLTPTVTSILPSEVVL